MGLRLLVGGSLTRSSNSRSQPADLHQKLLIQTGQQLQHIAVSILPRLLLGRCYAQYTQYQVEIGKKTEKPVMSPNHDPNDPR